MLVTLAMVKSKQNIFIYTAERTSSSSSLSVGPTTSTGSVLNVNSLCMPIIIIILYIFLKHFSFCEKVTPLQRGDWSRQSGGVAGAGNPNLQRLQRDWCRGFTPLVSAGRRMS